VNQRRVSRLELPIRHLPGTIHNSLLGK